MTTTYAARPGRLPDMPGLIESTRSERPLSLLNDPVSPALGLG